MKVDLPFTDGIILIKSFNLSESSLLIGEEMEMKIIKHYSPDMLDEQSVLKNFENHITLMQTVIT